MLVTGCTARVEREGAGDESTSDVGLQTQAIENGETISDENYSGVVALQVYSQTLSSYATFCSGALVTNDTVITAAHCLGDVQGRDVYASMGWQIVKVSQRIPHDSYDVAVLQLAQPMAMWNWQIDHYVGGSATINWNDYVRPIFSGTNEELDGMGMICLGYGGADWENGPFEPPLTYGVFSGKYPTSWTGWGGVTAVDLVPERNGNTSEGGDSGGPCLDSINTVTGKLSVVLTSSYSMGVGAQDWAWWAAGTIMNL